MHAAAAPETLVDLLAAGDPDAIALVEPQGAQLTYAQVREAADAFARQLRALGVTPGATVALALPNGIGLVVALLGIARAGAIAAPLNPGYVLAEFAFYLEDIRPSLLLLPSAAGDAARAAATAAAIPLADVTVGGDGRVHATDRRFEGELTLPRAVDVVLFLHTSGTTSRPKGVPLRHENLCASTANITRWYDLTARDVSLCVMPLFHIHGIVFSTLSFLRAGATVIVPPKFSAGAFWPAVAAHGVTVVSAVPTIYRTLLLRADDDRAPAAGHHGIRFLRSSSSALPAADLHRLEARFGVPVIEAYSMTEASHQMCANPLAGERRPGSVGVGAFVDVAVMDDGGAIVPAGAEGEVVVRGPSVMRGYHDNPAANAAAFSSGWFRTGDRGRLDGAGYLTLVGRIKELINRGGEKISPVEIDEVLAQHPGVVEAVTFAMPDEKYGEEVAAAVVVRAGTTADDLTAHVAARLAPFKVPKRFVLTDAIPKTATGKVQRRLVAEAFAGAD